MKKIIILITILFLNIINFDAYSQVFPQNYFIPPLVGSNIITNNFGQIRPNHFHAGVDIKTRKIGIPIVATADGYVSRIRISKYGYGRALYVTHPNGYKTVYGHLSKFSPEIEIYAKKVQLEKQSFEFAIYPDSSFFKVKQGDIIAYSGNTGRSSGPHLHYEIREALKDVPINPELTGLYVADKYSPKLTKVIIYPIDKNSKINGVNSRQILNADCKSNKCFLNKTIIVNGKIGFGANAYDLISTTGRKQAVYSARILMDGKQIFEYNINKVSFYESRGINSFLDYYERQKTGNKYQKYYIEPGNYLGIYNWEYGNGVIELQDYNTHKIQIILEDIKHNKFSVSLKIKKGKTPSVLQKKHSEKKVYFDKDFFFVQNDFRMIIQKNSLYKNIDNLYYKEYKSSKYYYSKVYSVQNKYTALSSPILISIKGDKVSEDNLEKGVILHISDKGRVTPLKTNYINGFYSAKSKYFGKFALTIDNVRPTIKVLTNFSSTKKLSVIKFKITDNLSGIKKLYATIDNKFVLLKYDKRYKVYYYKLAQNIKNNSNHEIILEVFDKKNNKAVYKTVFFR